MFTPFSLGFGAFMVVIRPHRSGRAACGAFEGGLVTLPMAVMFFHRLGDQPSPDPTLWPPCPGGRRPRAGARIGPAHRHHRERLA